MGEELRVKVEGVRVYSPNERDKSKNTRIIREQKVKAYNASVIHCRQYIDTSRGKPKLVVPVDVHLTRLGKRELDAHDNLGAAFKHVTDGVAFALCSPDNNPLIRWFYHQAKGETGFELCIHERRERVVDLVEAHKNVAVVRPAEGDMWEAFTIEDGRRVSLGRSEFLWTMLPALKQKRITGIFVELS